MDWDELDVFDDSNERRATISSFDSKSKSSKGFGSSRRSSALFRPDKRMKGEGVVDSVALSESPLVKSKSAQDEFEGFSIVKNRVPSAMNSPFTKGDILFRSLHSRERSSSNGRVFSATTPHSPLEFHTPMSQRGGSEHLVSTIATLKEEVTTKDALIVQLKDELAASKSATIAAQEEANAGRFMCSLQEQRILELEQKQSSDRMDMNEALSQKSRKHRAAVKKLQQERAAYEERADSMIAQMTEQMTQLQKMAMSRIEALEKELMAQRHSNDQLQAECTRLHSCAATAMASATKHRQLAASLKLSSPASPRRFLFSPQQMTNSGELRRQRPRHSSTGSSSCASTVLHDDDAEDGENGDDDDESEGGTVVDENESVENGQHSPFSSPSLDKLRVSPFRHQQNIAADESWSSI